MTTGPRQVFEWSDDDGLIGVEITPTVDADGVGHVWITVQAASDPNRDVTEETRQVRFDFDADNTQQLSEALADAAEWLRSNQESP